MRSHQKDYILNLYNQHIVFKGTSRPRKSWKTSNLLGYCLFVSEAFNTIKKLATGSA